VERALDVDAPCRDEHGPHIEAANADSIAIVPAEGRRRDHESRLPVFPWLRLYAPRAPAGALLRCGTTVERRPAERTKENDRSVGATENSPNPKVSLSASRTLSTNYSCSESDRSTSLIPFPCADDLDDRAGAPDKIIVGVHEQSALNAFTGSTGHVEGLVVNCLLRAHPCS
jgi:cytoskeletal protein RodZ